MPAPVNMSINARARESASFPPVFASTTHPLLPNAMSRALVFWLGIKMADRKRRSNDERDLKIPLESDERSLEDEGKCYLKLQHGDMLFGRTDAVGLDHWQDDVVLGWFLDGRLFTPEEKEDTEEAITALLGPNADRRPERVAIEALGLKGVGGSRCITMGPTCQQSPHIVAPSSKLKLAAEEEGLGDIQLVVKKVLETFTPFALRSVEHAPESIVSVLKDQTDLVGMPRIGCDANWAFPSVQCNIAAAKSSDSNVELKDEMGHFSDAHGDAGDAIGFFTCMLALPQLPEGYHPGNFFLLYLGVYATLDPFVTLNFSGRQAHGATAPRAPRGVKPANDAHRCNLVFYPPKSMTTGEPSRYTLASHGGKPMYRTPEMVDYSGDQLRSQQCTDATWARDGACMMESDSLAQFMTRGCLEVCNDMMGQVTGGLDVEIDGDILASAITYTNEDGDRVHPTLSTMTPRYGGMGNENERRLARNRFKQWQERASKFYPSSVPKPKAATKPKSTINRGGKVNRAKQSNTTPDDSDEQSDVSDDHEENDREVNAKQAGGERARDMVRDSDSDEREEDGGMSRDTGSGRDDDVMGDSFGSGRRGENGRQVSAKEASRGNGESGNAELDDVGGAGDAEGGGHTAPQCRVTGWRVVQQQWSDKDKGVSDAERLRDTEGQDHTTEAGGMDVDMPLDERSTTGDSDSSIRGTKRRDMGDASPDAKSKRARKVTKSFLERISYERVLADVRMVDSEYAMVRSHSMARTTTVSIESLPRIRASIMEAPDSLMSLAGVRNLLDIARRSEVAAASMAGDLRTVRAVIVDNSTYFWEWHDKEVPSMIAKELGHIRPGSPRTISEEEGWTAYLTREVVDFFVQGNKLAIITIPGYITVPRSTVTLHNPRGRRCSSTDPSYEGMIVECVQSALRQALEIDNVSEEHLRACAFLMLKQRCGMHFLRLECAWDLFINFDKSGFTSAKGWVSQKKEVEECGALVSAHLRESKVDELLAVLEAVLEGRVDRGTVPLYRHPQLKNLYSQEWDELWTLVLTALRMESGNEVQGNDELRSIKQILIDDPNGYLPFRERAPDLKRARSHGGFYQPDVVKTKAGIFSALVWRVISFNTRFSQEQPMLYEDDCAYLERVASCPSDGNYACLPNAYGHPIKDNGPMVAKVFWDSLTNNVEKWEDFAGSHPTFEECLKYFRKKNSQKKNLFPGLGNLLSFLLVNDLSIAGVCTPPTEAQVSSCMRQNKGGSFRELQRLHLIPSNLPDKRESDVMTMAAFLTVQDFLGSKLSIAEKEAIGYNVICLEHILCKAYKLGKHLKHARLDDVWADKATMITI